MATTVGTFTFYDSYLDYDPDLLATNTFKIQLHTSVYTPDAANHNFQDDLTDELPTANGYTVGGITLASKTWIRAGNTKTFDSDNPVWNAVGGDITARRWVIVDTTPGTPATNTLICFGLINAADLDVTAPDTLSLIIDIDPDGWFTHVV